MGDLKTVLADYNKFVQNIVSYSKDKVEETVSTISQKTNSKYSSDGVDQKIQLVGAATKYSVVESKDFVIGKAMANESNELIYLEFGTRGQGRDNLSIRSDFESKIDAPSIALPYKGAQYFRNKQPINGRYYFLNTIDEEGIKFVKEFGK